MAMMANHAAAAVVADVVVISQMIIPTMTRLMITRKTKKAPMAPVRRQRTMSPMITMKPRHLARVKMMIISRSGVAVVDVAVAVVAVVMAKQPLERARAQKPLTGHHMMAKR